jgi:hypothetical protein
MEAHASETAAVRAPSRSGGERWRRAAALGGIAFVALVVTAVVLTIGLDQPGAGSSARKISAFYADSANRKAVMATLYLMGVGAFAFLWFLAALRVALRRAGEPAEALSTLAFGAGIVFLVMLLAANASNSIVAAAFQFGQEFKRAPLDPQIVRLTNGASYWLSVYAAVAGGVFVGAASLAGRAVGVFPRWLAYGGYAVMLIGVASVLFPVGLLLSLLWVLAASIVLMRQSRLVVPR